jgi:hypothetical protein
VANELQLAFIGGRHVDVDHLQRGEFIEHAAWGAGVIHVAMWLACCLWHNRMTRIDAVHYSFIVMALHHALLAGLSRRFADKLFYGHRPDDTGRTARLISSPLSARTA